MKQMKQKVMKCVSILITLAMVMTFSTTTALADSESMEGYTPTPDSTWGDLYRYFDAEAFYAMPQEQQQLYDSILLNDDSYNTEVTAQAVKQQDETSWITTEGYIYGGESADTRETDIKGLLALIMGVSSTVSTIDYTVGFGSTISCPRLHISLTIYDKTDGKYVHFDDAYERNSVLCNLDDTCSGLVSGRTYHVRAIGTVVPPDGYYTSGPMTTSIDKATK